MELILKEDVQNLGFKDDIVNVKNGYGRNYLIPQGLAAMATSSAKKVLAENLKQRAHKEKKVVAEANKLAEALKQLEIKLTAKTAGGDKLFGSISNIDVAAAFEKAGQAIEKSLLPYLVELSSVLEHILLRFVCIEKLLWTLLLK